MSDELDLVRMLRSEPDVTHATDTARSIIMNLLTTTVRATQVLETVQSVLLIDWHEDVPRTLLAAGFEVVSWYDTTTRGELADQPPADDRLSVFPPRPDDDRGYLVWVPVLQPLTHVDMVCTFRPPAEHLEYLERFAIPLGARVFWVEAGNAAHGRALGYEGADHTNPTASVEVRARAAEAGIEVIEGLSLSEAVRERSAR
jgi:predicted CoA-binding protein